MKYTVAELIEVLEQLPKKMKIQIDADGAIYNSIHVDRVGKDLVVIFTEGESEF